MLHKAMWHFVYSNIGFWKFNFAVTGINYIVKYIKRENDDISICCWNALIYTVAVITDLFKHTVH